jgi:acyl-CoA thioester hydrolase
MGEKYSQPFRARWPDMDFNQHMRNAAFLGCSEDTRMGFLDAHGFGMGEFMKRRIGPVVLEDKLTYKKELKLLERFTVEMQLAGITEDGRRMRVRNRFVKEDGTLCAVVDSVILWLDLDARKPVVPPPELKALWMGLERSEDFAPL